MEKNTKLDKIPLDCWDCPFAWYDQMVDDYKCALRYCRYEKEMKEREEKKGMFDECKMLTELPKNADFSNPPNINIFKNIDEGQRKLKEYLSTFKEREENEE